MKNRVYNRARAQFKKIRGTANNGLNCGTFYVNLNNTFSNTNWNNDAALTYPKILINAVVYPCVAEINSSISSLVGSMQNMNKRG